MTIQVSYTQAGRLLAVTTVLGEDALLLERLEVAEGVNQLFTIRATVRAQTEDVRADSIVGTSADVTLTLTDGRPRTWNGLVTELHEGPIVTRGARQYALTLRPRLWLMSQRSDCRIFLDQTTLQVVETLCAEHGIADLDLAGVTAPPEKQPYAVQWNETDLAYLLRRLEEDGKFYYFRHAAGRHTLVVGDHSSAYGEGDPSQVRLSFGSSDGEHIHDWRRQMSFTPGKRAGGDWEFTTPNTRLQATTPSLVRVPGNAAYELYEYPGRFLSPQAGEAATRLRIQATETDFDRIEGRSTVRTLAAGHRFTPYEVAHPEHAYEPQVVSHILHRAEDPTYETGAGSPHYENEFGVMPASLPATPHRATPRPRIDGLQIARIAGPAGEEIHTDAFGRVKLTFPWDRRAKADGTDTGWVRVSQSWGGGTWGQQIIPRIGMEALVAYQEGDPDRPIVVGIVPNPNNPVPYDLPGHKTKLVIRSDTHKGTGYNEVSMEDEAGQENLFTHAQKDMTTKVLNDATTRVDANQVSSIGANHSMEVANNQNQQVGGSRSLTVGAVGGAASAALGAAMSAMSGQTAGLLGQAMGVAMQAMGAAGAGGGASGGGSGEAAGGDAGGAGLDPSALAGLASGFTSLIGGGGIGGLLGGGIDGLRSGINAASAKSMIQGGGAGMAGAGTQMAGQVGGMMGGLGGVMNTMVSRFQNTTTGIGSTEQVGVTKVVNVGHTSRENVGKVKKLTVGEEFVIEVGASKFIMRKDGTVIILGTNFNFTASGPVQINGSVVDLNKPGSPNNPAPKKSNNATTAPKNANASSGKANEVEKVLGKEAANIVSQSPTLKSNLDTLADREWTLQRSDQSGTEADAGTKTITIGSERLGSAQDAVQGLSHEAGHALYTGSPNYSSRDAFINSMLADEGAATLNNIQAQREIVANGGPDIGIAGTRANLDAYNQAYDSMVAGGSRTTAQNAIGQIYGSGEIASGSNQPYRDYYGNFYDQTHPRR